MLHHIFGHRGKFLLILLLGLVSGTLRSQSHDISWSTSFDWEWVESSQFSSTTILDFAYHSDTFYLATSTGVFTSVDARNWELKPLKIEMLGFTYRKGRIAFVNHLRRILQGNNLENLTMDQMAEDERFVGRFISSPKAESDWYTTQTDPNSDRHYLCVPGDSIPLPEDIAYISHLMGDYFLVSFTDITKSSRILHVKSREYYPTLLNSNYLGISIEQSATSTYVLGEEVLYEMKVSEGEHPQLNPVRNVEMGDILVRYGDVIALKSVKALTPLYGRLSREDSTSFSNLNVEHLHKYGDRWFAISKTEGLALLRPNGIVGITPISAADPSIDGLFELCDKRYALNWSYFGDYWNNGYLIRDEYGCFPIEELVLFFEGAYLFFESNRIGKPNDVVALSLAEVTERFPVIDFSNGENFYQLNGNPITVHALGRDSLIIVRSDGKGNRDGFYLMNLNEPDSLSHIFHLKDERLYFSGSYTQADSAVYWVSTRSRVIFINESFEPFDTVSIESVRDVRPVDGGLLIASYGQGLHFYSADKENRRLRFNSDESNQYFSEIGFDDGTLYALSNSGIYFQDSVWAMQLLNENHPLFLINTAVNTSIEVNGRLFGAALKNSDGTLDISTSRGILTWNSDQVLIKSMNRYDLAWEEFLGMAISVDRSKSNNQAFLFYRESPESSWQPYNSDDDVFDESFDWLLYSYDGYGGVSLYHYLGELNSNITLYTLMGVILLLMIILAVILVRQYRSRLLQAQSLKYGWRPSSQEESSKEVLLLQLLEHDMKGGLNILQGLLEYFPKAHAETRSSVLDQSVQMINRLKQTIGERLDVVYRTSDSESRIRIDHLIEKAVDEVKDYAQLKRVSIHNHNALRCYVENFEVLERAIHICLGNAIKFSSPQSLIVISSMLNGCVLSIQITDSGIGLPAGWKLGGEGTLRKGASGERGMGIALTIISRMMMKYKGSVTLENREDRRGTVATLEWPVEPLKE